MQHSLLAVLYAALLGPAAVTLADLFYAFWAGPRYLRVRAEVDYLVRSLRSGGLSRRSASKALARLRVLRGELKRLLVARLLFLLPVYAAASLTVAARLSGALLPVGCCVPLVTVPLGDGCVTSPALVAAASFVAALPLLQEDLVIAAVAAPAARRLSNI